MSKLINAPNSLARRKIGRSFGVRCAMASAGSAGFICEYKAEILTDRLTTGNSSEIPPNGSVQPRVSAARTSSNSKQRIAYSFASSSETTASPRRSTVKPMPCLRRFRSVFITSSGLRPAMNCRAIPETFQRKIFPLTHGTTRARCTPV